MTEIEQYTPAGAPHLLDSTTDSWVAVVKDVDWLAGAIANTEFVPKDLRGNGAKVAAAILTGRELGLAPMTALSSIHVINGKPGISAELMRALVLQAGHEIVLVDVSSQKVVIKGRRQNAADWTTVTWTAQDAARAGLRGGNYDKYPRQMLTARATTELCRLIFADVIHGLRSIEELDELGPDEVVVGDVPEPDAPQAPAETRKVTRKRAAKQQPVDQQDQGDQPAQTPQEPQARRRPSVTRRGQQSGEGTGPGSTGAGEAPERDGAAAQGAAAAPDPEPQDEIHEAEIVEETPAPPADVEPLPAEEAEPRLTDKQRNLILVRFNELQIEDRAERMWTSSQIVGRELTSANDLSRSEAGRLIDSLARCQTRGDVELVVDQAQKQHGADQ